MIYPVDSAIQRSNNRGQADKITWELSIYTEDVGKTVVTKIVYMNTKDFLVWKKMFTLITQSSDTAQKMMRK